MAKRNLTRNLTTDYSDTDTGIGIAANTWRLRKYLQSSKCSDTYSATRTCGNQFIFFIAVCDPTWGIWHLCMHLGLMCSKIQTFRLPAKQKSRRLCSRNHCSGYCQNNEIKFPNFCCVCSTGSEGKILPIENRWQKVPWWELGCSNRDTSIGIHTDI